MREIRPSGLTRGGEANLPAYSTQVIFLSFYSFYRAAGLAWIRGGRWPASFPLLYRAVGLAPIFFRPLTAPRREPATLLRRTDKRIAQRIGSQATTMHIISAAARKPSCQVNRWAKTSCFAGVGKFAHTVRGARTDRPSLSPLLNS